MNYISCIQPANAVIAECPVWDPVAGVLYWVDIKRPAVFRWNPRKGQTGHWPMPKPIGCISIMESAHLAFADSDGFGLLDLTTGNISRTVDPERHLPDNRFNDGKVDRAGRLWAGTMHDHCAKPSGSLYRLTSDGTVQSMASGFICSNGLGWSPDGCTMYFTDSMLRTIWAYEFDLDSGTLGARRVFARLSDDDGVPDGLTVDSAGFVWSAIWDGWRVIRYGPDGHIDREVRLPVQRPTSCTLGGTDLKTLFITSASLDLHWQDLKAGPLAGALFTVQTDIAGLVENVFGMTAQTVRP